MSITLKSTRMNRKKKIIQIQKKRAKKANAKLAPPGNKPRYISKAEREKLQESSIEQSESA